LVPWAVATGTNSWPWGIRRKAYGGVEATTLCGFRVSFGV
jgi:hypothetical protein